MLTTRPYDDDHLNEECAIFGIFGNDEAAAHTALGLHALQHRGQEATGIVAFDGFQFRNHRDAGHVGDVFGSEETIRGLPGPMAIGHNRYATTGGAASRNIQPLFAEFAFGGFAIAHNGNLTNAASLRRDLVLQGSLFQSTTDTEVFIHLIARSKANNLVDRLIDAMQQVEGAYSLVALSQKKLIGVRDRHALRPLVLGRLGQAWIQRRRPARSTSSAPSSCATSSPARSS